MVGTITVNPSEEEETNSTAPMETEQEDMESSSNSLNGFLFVPAIALVLFISRYFR